MGCECSLLHPSRNGSNNVSSQITSRPLRIPNLIWSSPKPMTMAQWQKEVAAFWETAPSYSGRVEIWQVLKSVCESVQDLDLINALLEAAQITVPTGDLLDGVYDTLGNHYVIPQYCFSTPINLTTGSSPLKTSTALIPFEITLKPNIGPSITLAVTTHTTLLELKTQLHSFYSTQHRYLFFYMGQQLNLNQTLGDIQFINLPILQVMVVSPLSLDT